MRHRACWGMPPGSMLGAWPGTPPPFLSNAADAATRPSARYRSCPCRPRRAGAVRTAATGIATASRCGTRADRRQRASCHFRAATAVVRNGDIPHFAVTNGDGPEGLRWRRRAVRSPGKRGRLRLGAAPAHGGLSLRPQGRARFENFRTEIFGGRSSEADRLQVCRNGCAEMQRGGGRALPPRRAPFGRKESPPWAGVPPDAVRPRLPGRPPARLRRPRSAAPFPVASHRAMSPTVEKIARPGVLVLAEPWSRALFSSPSSGKCGRAASLARGDRAVSGGRAFRGLTRSATEWSAARRKPLRAAAMHFSAAISADVKARRLPTSARRKFPSGNFRSARDLEGAERVNPRKARTPTPQVRPRLLQRNEECPHFPRSLPR